MRAFVGLPLSEEVVDALARLQREVPAGRLVAPENLHLTLAFLDDQREPALAALHAELDGITGPVPRLRICGLDVFGGARARLLFAAVAPDPALETLQKKVRRAARDAGIDLPRTRFRPHVTLARFRKGDADRLSAFLTREGGFCLPECDLSVMALWQSTLMPAGPRYDLLASYPLG